MCSACQAHPQSPGRCSIRTGIWRPIQPRARPPPTIPPPSCLYIEHGQALGHSPNRYFDEAWHLRRYPRVAEAVRTGRVASAFDAYCREGLHGRSPHWLFDEFFYRTRYADLTETAWPRTAR